MTTEAELFEALKYRIEVDRHGTRRYYNSAGQLHRDDGPAVVWRDGDKEWYQNGLRHRDVDPAVVWYNGDEEWYQNGLRHREVGPAVKRKSGRPYRDWETDRKSTRLNSSHITRSRMPSSA